MLVTQLSVTLMLYIQAAEAQFGDNDRIKLMVLYCGDEDPAVQRACCGALAILSGEHSDKLVPKVTAVSRPLMTCGVVLS